jgi:phage gp36-like protein
MAYCTFEDIETRIGADDLAALADYDGDGAADPDIVAEAIRSAESLIDSYVGVRFAVPVDPAPDILRTRAVNLAVYFLRLGRDSVTEDARAQYEDDVHWLNQVAAGGVSLGIEDSPGESSGAATARFATQPRLFGRDEPL